MYNIILGSSSPRRHEILTLAGIEHTVIVPEADECKIHYVGDCQRYVKELAKLKSDALTELLKSDEYKTKIDFSDTVTICADKAVSPRKTEKFRRRVRHAECFFGNVSLCPHRRMH